MKTKKIMSTVGALTAAAVTASAASICSYASLHETNGVDKAAYEIIPSQYIDYAKVDAIEADVTVKDSEYAFGGMGVTLLDSSWVSSSYEINGDGSATIRLEDLGGIFAIDDGSPCIYVQVWELTEGATFTVEDVRLYDADGNAVVEGEEAVERPEVKFPDAEPLDIDNSKLDITDQNNNAIDIAKAVGDDFGEIAKITATIKWAEGSAWNGCGVVSNVQLEDGTILTWYQEESEIGTCNDYSYLIDEENAVEYTYTIFEDQPVITDLSYTGKTGEIGGYGTLLFNFWGEYRDSKDLPAVSNISFYNNDGKLISELNYETVFDVVEEPAVEEEPTVEEPVVEEAPAQAGDVDAAVDSTKGSPDTGAADVAVIGGIALAAAAAIVLGKKSR